MNYLKFQILHNLYLKFIKKIFKYANFLFAINGLIEYLILLFIRFGLILNYRNLNLILFLKIIQNFFQLKNNYYLKSNFFTVLTEIKILILNFIILNLLPNCHLNSKTKNFLYILKSYHIISNVEQA